MSQDAERILTEAMDLSIKERAAIAEQLIRSLDGPADDDHNVEQAWDQEIKKRIDEIDSGKVEMIPWEKVQADIEEKLRAKRNISSRG